MTVETAPSSLISRDSLALSMAYAPPDGDLERLIAGIFAEVFTLDRVGVDDDFLDLGGDSLLAEVLSTLISQRTGQEFQLSLLNNHGSPRRIASLVENSSNGIAPAVAGDPQTRPPIFVVHGRGGYTLLKPEFHQALARGQKVRMFELPGIRGGTHCDRIEDVAAIYIEQLNREYPDGPILLAAFCAGGMIALEIARQLSALGRPIRHLVLLDPPVRRNGTLGVSNSGGGPPYVTPQDWVAAKLRRLLPKSALLRHLELKYRKQLFRKKNRDIRAKYADVPLSATPRAKLQLAYIDYKPHRHDGPVTILASRQREPFFRDGHYVAKLLPNRTVQVVVEGHGGITGPRSAEFMQAAFDAALAAREL